MGGVATSRGPLLPAWGAASVLIGCTAAFAVLGAWRIARADISESK
jgi:hypothetical protein